MSKNKALEIINKLKSSPASDTEISELKDFVENSVEKDNLLGFKINIFEEVAGQILFLDYKNMSVKEFRDTLITKFTNNASELKDGIKDNNGLLPCPLCGGKAKAYHRVNANTVTCQDCGIKVSQSELGMGDAEEIWNRRV